MASDRRLRYHWGCLLRQARLDAGLTQKAFAHHLGVAQEIVSRWENGIYAPRDETRPRIAAALNKTVADLFPYPDDTNGNADGSQAA